MSFVLITALRGCAGPDVLVCDVIRVPCRDADGKFRKSGGDFTTPERRKRWNQRCEGERRLKGVRWDYIPAFEFSSVWFVLHSTYHKGCQVTKFMGNDVEQPIFQSF